MYLISISFNKKIVPDHFRDIHNQQCIKYYIDSSGFFLIVTDKNEILHYYRIDCIVAFHIEYLGEYVE